MAWHTATRPREQFLKLQPIVLSLAPLLVIAGDCLTERPAPDEPHGVERLVVFRSPAELIDRDDVGVLELAGDLGFLEEPALCVGVLRAIAFDLLESDLAVEVGVAGEPDPAQPPLGVDPRQRVP